MPDKSMVPEKRVKAPMPPISEEEANIITKPMSLYFARSFMGVLFLRFHGMFNAGVSAISCGFYYAYAQS